MRAGGPRTLGNTTGCGPEARVPWGILPDTGRRPAYPGEYYRMRAGGPRTRGNAPKAGRRPAYPGEYYRIRAGGPRTRGNAAGGPRTQGDNLSGVILNIPLSVVIHSTSPFLSQMGEEGVWGKVRYFASLFHFDSLRTIPYY